MLSTSERSLYGRGAQKLLKEKGAEGHEYEIVALSGTSGGSICALLAWCGLLMNDTDKAAELLDSFWKDDSATSFHDSILNDWLLQTNRFFGNIGGMPTVSPYLTPVSSWASDQLKGLLERHVDFGRIQRLVKPSSPMLLISAADVVSGEFKVPRKPFHALREIAPPVRTPCFLRRDPPFCTAQISERQAQLTERSLNEQNERLRLNLEVDLLHRMQDRYENRYFIARRSAVARYFLDNAVVDDDMVEVKRLNDAAIDVCNFFEHLAYLQRIDALSAQSV